MAACLHLRPDVNEWSRLFSLSLSRLFFRDWWWWVTFALSFIPLVVGDSWIVFVHVWNLYKLIQGFPNDLNPCPHYWSRNLYVHFRWSWRGSVTVPISGLTPLVMCVSILVAVCPCIDIFRSYQVRRFNESIATGWLCYHPLTRLA